MSKVEEANAHIRNAEKSLKTTLLKWRPDFDVAADEYVHAATCFRIVKDYAKSRECLLKACDCYKENKSWFHAAKNLEQTLFLLKEMGKLDEAPQIAHRACSLYQQHGSPESAANVLDKAAKMLETKQPEQALELFTRAADVVMGEDSPRQAAEYMSKAARILVKLGKYDQAADAVRREIGMHQQIDHQPSIGRLAVVLVLIQLARGDQIAAEKAFKEWGNYCDAPEVQTLEMLLQAYDNEDADSARSALNSPFIKHMDVEYARLARGLPLPQQEYAVPPVGVRANAAPSYISPNANKLTGQATVEAEVTPGFPVPTREEEFSRPVATDSPVESKPAITESSFGSKPALSRDESQPESEPETSPVPMSPKVKEEDDYEEGLC